MASIHYESNAARKIQPLRTPQTPAPKGRPTPGPVRQPGGSAAGVRLANKRRVAAVLIAIALVLAWIVPSLIADASAEVNAAALARADRAYNDAVRENIRLRNEAERAISAEEAYDTAVGEYGMVRNEEDPVIISDETE